MVIHNTSYAVTFITKSAADMVHEQAQSVIQNASCANDIFPSFHEKFCIEPEDSEEDSETLRKTLVISIETSMNALKTGKWEDLMLSII